MKPQPPLGDALSNQCSVLMNHISDALAGAATSLKPRFDSALENLRNQGKWPFLASIPRFAAPASTSLPSLGRRSPVWARIPRPDPAGSWAEAPIAQHRFDLAMSTESVEERLAGIPVYALSNSAEEFVLVSGVKSGKSLGLFCFKRQDAEALLEQISSMRPEMRQGSKVVAVALNKTKKHDSFHGETILAADEVRSVPAPNITEHPQLSPVHEVFRLKVDGVAFRFIPDSCQIMNAIKVQEQVGKSVESFSGVPVFQSRSLVFKSQNKRYRPVFFRKEDLEESLLRASQQQNYLNPALRKGDIQVSVLEEMIAAMKGNSTSKWDDVVFIPPGFNSGLGLLEQPVATA